MNIYTLVMIIPVVLAVALIIMVIRRNITERKEGQSVDIAAVIPAVIILMLACMVIAPMAESTQDYTFDEASGELTIRKNVAQLATQPWDSYADEVTSLVIKDGVTIGAGAFGSLTGLEYVSIGEGVTLGSAAFVVTFNDSLDQTVTDPSGEFVGTGDGTLYECDASLFHYYSAGIIDGVNDPAMKTMVIPATHDGTPVTSIGNNSFTENASIVRILFHPDSELSSIGSSAFYKCSALVTVSLPASVTTLKYRTFSACTTLAVLDAPGIENYESSCFQGSTSLTSGPSAVTKTILTSAYNTCRDLTTLVFSATIENIGSWAFSDCTGITEVTFEPGFAPTTFDTLAFRSWTFYASDGTTTIDKTVAANLAGKTFQGTAAALVEVAEGQLSLTPQQLQQVQLHTQELQGQTDQISIEPLPFSPSVQTNDIEVTA